MKPTTVASPNCERDLISRAIEGNESAFSELFELHKDQVYSLCLRMTANVPEAEDLMQEAFLQVFRKLATFRNESALSTWIYRIAVNTTLMRLRKRNLCQVSLDQWMVNKQTKQELELSRDDSHLRGTVDRLALIRAISELPPGYRTVFLLHEVEGYGHQELARLLNCTVGNTRSQLHKARLRIREFLLNSKTTRDIGGRRRLADSSGNFAGLHCLVISLDPHACCHRSQRKGNVHSSVTRCVAVLQQECGRRLVSVHADWF